MKKWKKITAGMLSACLVANCIPAVSEIGGFIETNITAQAATTENVVSGNCGEMTSSGEFGKNVKYTYDYETKTLTISGTGNMYNGYEDEDGGTDDEEEYYYNFLSDSPNKKIIKGEMGKLVIQDGVTNIGGYAFKECTALKEVEMGKSVKVIEEYAFEGCTALKKVHWTDKIEEIAEGSFRTCENLTKLYVGKSVKSIDDYAFIRCNNLKQIKVHKSNQNFSMRGNMLLNRKQTKLVLGCFASDTTCHIYSSVTSFNVNALTDKNIEKFEVSSKNKKYASKNGLLYSKDGKTLYLCPRGKEGTATVSDRATKIDGISKNYTFHYAFQNCDKLETIIIGKNVKKLAGYCFEGCSNLKKVKIHKRNNYYSSEDAVIFSKNKKKLVCCISSETDIYTVPAYVTTIAKNAFNYCDKLKHIVLSDKITEYKPGCLGEDFYDEPKIESITLGRDYYNGGNVQFLTEAEYLKNIYVSEENPYYSSVDGILYNKEQTKLLACPSNAEVCKMPNTVTSVKNNAFSYNYNIKEMYVSDGITDVANILDKCHGLKTLYIGKNVKKIQRVEGLGMEQLEQITVSPENQNYKGEDGILYSKDGSRFVWCPEQKQGTVTVSSGTAIIGESAFYGCEKVTDIVLPATVTTIEKDAFAGMGNERTIVFWVPAGMKERYLLLLTSETGFRGGMFVKELQS